MSLTLVDKQTFHLSASIGFLGIQQTRLALTQIATNWKITNRKLCDADSKKCLLYNLNLEDSSSKPDLEIQITQGHQQNYYFVEAVNSNETLAFDTNVGLYWSTHEAVPFQIKLIQPPSHPFQPKSQDLASLMLELQNTKAALQVCQTNNKKKGCCIA
jgi:hypothetical protein